MEKKVANGVCKRERARNVAKMNTKQELKKWIDENPTGRSALADEREFHKRIVDFIPEESEWLLHKFRDLIIGASNGVALLSVNEALTYQCDLYRKMATDAVKTMSDMTKAMSEMTKATKQFMDKLRSGSERGT